MAMTGMALLLLARDAEVEPAALRCVGCAAPVAGGAAAPADPPRCAQCAAAPASTTPKATSSWRQAPAAPPSAPPAAATQPKPVTASSLPPQRSWPAAPAFPVPLPTSIPPALPAHTPAVPAAPAPAPLPVGRLAPASAPPTVAKAGSAGGGWAGRGWVVPEAAAVAEAAPPPRWGTPRSAGPASVGGSAPATPSNATLLLPARLLAKVGDARGPTEGPSGRVADSPGRWILPVDTPPGPSLPATPHVSTPPATFPTIPVPAPAVPPFLLAAGLPASLPPVVDPTAEEDVPATQLSEAITSGRVRGAEVVLTPQAWGRANTDAGASLQRAEAVLRQLREAEAAWLVSLAAGAGDPVPSPAPSARPSVLVTPELPAPETSGLSPSSPGADPGPPALMLSASPDVQRRSGSPRHVTIVEAEGLGAKHAAPRRRSPRVQLASQAQRGYGPPAISLQSAKALGEHRGESVEELSNGDDGAMGSPVEDVDPDPDPAPSPNPADQELPESPSSHSRMPEVTMLPVSASDLQPPTQAATFAAESPPIPIPAIAMPPPQPPDPAPATTAPLAPVLLRAASASKGVPRSKRKAASMSLVGARARPIARVDSMKPGLRRAPSHTPGTGTKRPSSTPQTPRSPPNPSAKTVAAYRATPTPKRPANLRTRPTPRFTPSRRSGSPSLAVSQPPPEPSVKPSPAKTRVKPPKPSTPATPPSSTDLDAIETVLRNTLRRARETAFALNALPPALLVPLELPEPEPIHTVVRLRKRGEGGQSSIWEVEFDGRPMIAKYPLESLSQAQVEQMLGAARLQESVQHPNVLRVEAVLRADPGPCVILEPAHRDVSDLFTHDAIPGTQQWRLALGIARGIQALHAATPPIIHRDIKATNIFITEAMEPKLADFDLAVQGDTAQGLNVGTPGFIAPEVFLDHPYDAKVDVFSFGSLLYELAHSNAPFWFQLDESFKKDAARWGQAVSELMLEGHRPPLDEAKCSPRLRKLIRRCWAQCPIDRPTMDEVVQELEGMEADFTAALAPAAL